MHYHGLAFISFGVTAGLLCLFDRSSSAGEEKEAMKVSVVERGLFLPEHSEHQLAAFERARSIDPSVAIWTPSVVAWCLKIYESGQPMVIEEVLLEFSSEQQTAFFHLRRVLTAPSDTAERDWNLGNEFTNHCIATIKGDIKQRDAILPDFIYHTNFGWNQCSSEVLVKSVIVYRPVSDSIIASFQRDIGDAERRRRRMLIR